MHDPITRLNAALDGRYQIERELGEGGMATVYLADDLRHRRKVAVKVLRSELSAAVGADRFLREIETTAGLRHPHILPLYDSGEEEGVLFYVMPFIEGPSLRGRLDGEKQLPLDEALGIACAVADALSYAHGRGVIHRDIKPENILLENGQAVVADFGIANAVSASGRDNLTRTGTVLGTPLYMSPEQSQGESVDARSDLYSLACVAYEMLAGTPPFTGPTAFVVLARHSLDPVPALRTTRPAVPGPVAEAIERALAKTPADRFATVGEWREAIGRPAAGGPDAAAVESGTTLHDARATTDFGVPIDVSLGVAPSDRPSIAILPFTSLGSDADQEFIVDGIRFGIQATLVQLSGMFLVNASTLNAYRGKDVSAALVGAELGVRYILEGAAQQSGQRIRVTVQLTDVEARRTIWAERYDRLLEDVFELQDEISREVISSLNVKLLHSELARGWFGKLTSPDAREFCYRGMSYLYEFTKEENAQAREMFLELSRVQPDSVMGSSYIAVTHWLDASHGWSENPGRSAVEAETWAKKAVEYEDNNGLGHVVLGHLLLLDRQHERALAICSEGVDLRKSCPLAHGLLGVILNYCGDPGAAIQEVREALRLERVYPVWLLSVLAAAYRDDGNVELSILAARESLRLDPRKTDALAVLCSDYQFAGNHERAEGVADDIMTLDPKFCLSAYAESQPYADTTSLARVTHALRDAGLPA